MPIQYVKPEGTRKLEFWKTGRGIQYSLVISVPIEWDDDQIKDELEEWGSQYCPTSEYVRYGWNDEKDFGCRD